MLHFIGLAFVDQVVLLWLELVVHDHLGFSVFQQRSLALGAPQLDQCRM